MDATELMLRAVKLARRGLGQTAPNPCVGALLVADGQVMAEGWHARYGGPHAEVAVIAEAQAKGVDPAACDLFVTLEPCNHQGKTPPCTEAVLAAGIRRVFIGTRDPNPDVTGGGADFLRDRGVAVELGVAEEACRDLIADFLTWKTTTRTYNFLKMAMTIDGKTRRPRRPPVRGQLRGLAGPGAGAALAGWTRWSSAARPSGPTTRA